jgi:hypothetical protein
MKSKFVLTEEESKRILSLHKEKIDQERKIVSEQIFKGSKTQTDTGQMVGRSAAGAGVGAGVGAIVGALLTLPIGGVGAAAGAYIGTGLGAFIGMETGGGGYYDKIFKILKWCNTNRGKIGNPVNNDSDIRDIADDISSAVEGLGRTDEVMIARSFRKLKSIPDLCRLNDIYRKRNNESLLNALDGDIDSDGEWRDYVWRPIEELSTFSKNQSKKQLLIVAKKCGWGNINDYKKSGWKCKKSNDGSGNDDLLQKANRCGWDSVEGYKKSGWKCKKTDGGSNNGGVGGGGSTYTFDYNKILTAINQKCPGGSNGSGGTPEDDVIVNPFGQGAEQGQPQPQAVIVTDKIYAGLQ